jgi:hypothetical protein
MINPVILKLMTFVENAETGQFLFLIKPGVSFKGCISVIAFFVHIWCRVILYINDFSRSRPCPCNEIFAAFM